jgi:hypothetical protein
MRWRRGHRHCVPECLAAGPHGVVKQARSFSNFGLYKDCAPDGAGRGQGYGWMMADRRCRSDFVQVQQVASLPSTSASTSLRLFRSSRFVSQRSPAGFRGNVGLEADAPLGHSMVERSFPGWRAGAVRSPNGAASESPRLPPGGYLGSLSVGYPQPQRGCGNPFPRIAHPVGHSPVWVVKSVWIPAPKVAPNHSGQPWALGRSHFGADAMCPRRWAITYGSVQKPCILLDWVTPFHPEPCQPNAILPDVVNRWRGHERIRAGFRRGREGRQKEECRMQKPKRGGGRRRV